MKDTIATPFRAAAGARTASRAAVAVTLLGLAWGLGGCVSDGAGAGSGAFAMASSNGSTVAFESIDGPPPQIFDRMVSVLDSESKLRNLSIVAREDGASFRICSDRSAQGVRRKT